MTSSIPRMRQIVANDLWDNYRLLATAEVEFRRFRFRDQSPLIYCCLRQVVIKFYRHDRMVCRVDT